MTIIPDGNGPTDIKAHIHLDLSAQRLESLSEAMARIGRIVYANLRG